MSHSPTKDWKLEVFDKMDFAETETQTIEIQQGIDTDTILRRMSYIWKSQLQSKCTLSSTESEVTGISYSLHATRCNPNHGLYETVAMG
jgi:hypothetical protein